MLSKEDRSLFIRALGSRWVLDVSKEHIMANRFGMIDRDYADPAGRDELCNEYFANSLSTQPGVALSEHAYEEAFEGMLSAQVNDAVDYSQTRNADLSANLSRGAQLFGSARTTAAEHGAGGGSGGEQGHGAEQPEQIDLDQADEFAAQDHELGIGSEFHGIPPLYI